MPASWDVDLVPVPCPGLATWIGVIHVAVAAAPWLAGCAPWTAAALSALTGLAGWSALPAVPGSRRGIRRLRSDDSGWSATLADGIERPAELLPGSRVLPTFVFCQVRVAGQKLDWWLPGYAVPATRFRHFKVALRCRPRRVGPALLDSSLSNPEEAARPGHVSRRAN